MVKYFSFIVFIIICFFNHNALSNTEINIDGGNADPIHLEITEPVFDSLRNDRVSYEIQTLLLKQLRESGFFTITKKYNKETSGFSFFNFILNKYSNNFVLGELTISVTNNLPNKIEVELALNDKIENRVVTKSVFTSIDQWHRAASGLSDFIYKYYTKLDKGYLLSQIAYVAKSKHSKNNKRRIAIMDLYGKNLRYVTNGSNLVLSPKISKDGKKLIYFSYESNDYPTIIQLDLASNLKSKLYEFDGMLYAAKYSYDGSKVVMSASYNGNSEVVLLDLESRQLQRLTNHYAIDTSPSISPDNKQIVFNSDRDGSQQIYLFDIATKKIKQISFKSGRFASPIWSPDGRYIAFTRIYNNKFSIGIINMHNLETRILTESYKDESPSWSPNSKLLLFTRSYKNRKGNKNKLSKLFIIDLNGNLIKKINTASDASDANWQELLL
jgi:TolB protein